MLEVLFALMILGVGLIAVASIFPVATVLQRQTIDDIYSQQAGESIKASVRARGFSEAQLEAGINPSDFDVQPMPEGVLSDPDTNDPLVTDQAAGPPLEPIPWLLPDRCFPGFLPQSGAPSLPDESDDYEERQYYWVPLVQRDEDEDWQFFVFVLRNVETEIFPDDGGTYANPDDPLAVPRVRQHDDIDSVSADGYQITFNPDNEFHPTRDLDLGTQFLDNHGVVHTVVLISGPIVTVAAPVQETPTSIWYGVRSESDRISARKILTFGSEVLR